MSDFKESVLNNFDRAMKTFETFPATILSALAFSIVTVVRIYMDFPEQLDYNFLFNTLHLSFAVSAIFSFMAITASEARYNTKKAFVMANVLGSAMALISFLLLYFFAGVESGSIIRVSSLAASRVTATIIVSLIAFIYFSSHKSEKSSFDLSLFMFQKAFFIALIYGIVIMLGISSITGAIQALLYRDMSSKVYMYLATIAGFLTFTIFIGYFPDFRKDNVTLKRKNARRQPKFVQILFEYIMIPIVFMLSAILLIWSLKTVFTSDWPRFEVIIGIVTSYLVSGIWLHLMVTRSESRFTNIYRKSYPIISLVILSFGIWALVQEILSSGLKMDSYFFLLVCLVSAASVILLIIKKQDAHNIIALIISIAVIISVTPLINSYSLTNNVQVNRLEKLLSSQGILVDNKLIASEGEIDEDIRIAITDAVDYLAYRREANLPEWFYDELSYDSNFKNTLGFEKTYVRYEDNYPDPIGESLWTNLNLTNDVLDISDYKYALYTNTYNRSNLSGAQLSFEGTNGSYDIYWTVDDMGMPTIKIILDDQTILEEDMKDFLDDKSLTLESGKREASDYKFEDMTYKLENDKLTLLLVFRNININLNPRTDEIYYNMELHMIFINEK